MRNTISTTTAVHILVFFTLFLLSQTKVVFGAEYEPLVGIPGLDGDSKSFPEYINAVYKLLIAVGALYGVLKIAFAGVKYSLTDVITGKGSALADIKGVLLGLLLLIMPYVVLNTINSNLINLDVLDGVEPADIRSPIDQIPTERALTPAEHRAHMECLAKEGVIRDDGSCSETVFTEDGCDAVHMNWSSERNTCEGFDSLGATYRSSDLTDAVRFANQDVTSNFSLGDAGINILETTGTGIATGGTIGCAMGTFGAGVACVPVAIGGALVGGVVGLVAGTGEVLYGALFGEESSQETREHVAGWAAQCAQSQQRLVIINSGDYMHFNCVPSFDDEELFITTD